MRKLITALAMVAVGWNASASAQSYTLKNGNSTLRVDQRNGATVWRIDQDALSDAIPPDNLFLSNYFFRVGAGGPESNFFNALGAPTVLQNGADNVSFAFANDSLSATLGWNILGGPVGSGSSVLTKSVVITNLTGQAIDLNLFDYSDYDINFNPRNQADQAALIGPGRIVTTSSSVPFQITSQVTGNPDRYQITNFITPYLQFFIDQDGPTTLSNTPGLGVPFPSTPGDNAFAFQWSRTLSPGQSFSVAQTATFAAIPEPSSWAMLLIGFVAVGGGLRGSRRLAQTRGALAN